MFFLCLKIFVSRIIDVSLGTIRTMYIVKGKKFTSSLIAFFEVLVWFYAAKEALNTEINSFLILLSYALGFASGTYIGTIINETFIGGILSIQVISSTIKEDDITLIKENRFGLSVIKTIDNKYMLFIYINKKRLKECINLIKKLDKTSFIIINDAKCVYNGYIKNK